MYRCGGMTVKQVGFYLYFLTLVVHALKNAAFIDVHVLPYFQL